MASLAMMTFSLLACLWLGWQAIREHRRSMAARHRLLDAVDGILRDTEYTVAPDHFPAVTGTFPDGGRARVELCADTLVTRRLPQLWLRVTLFEAKKRVVPAIGALARPTGSEFYSVVHDLPEWLAPPETGTPLLMRGSGLARAQEHAALRHSIAAMLADPRVKEAVITPMATRIMIQAAEGERTAHIFLRQARFAIRAVPAPVIRQAIAEAEALRALAEQPTVQVRPRAA
jgi:hypothetical protein